MGLDKFRDPADALWETRINQLEEGTGVGEVTGAKIAKETISPEKTAASFFPKRPYIQVPCVVKESTAESLTQAYLLATDGTLFKTTTGKAEFGEKTPAFVNYFPALIGIAAGKTLKVEIAASWATGKAPVASITFGIYEVTSFGEVTKQIEPTVSLTAKSTAKVTTPAAKSTGQVSGAQVELTEKISYCLGLAVSATTASESLFVANVGIWIASTP